MDQRINQNKIKHFELNQNESTTLLAQVFNDKFYQTFMKDIVPIQHKLF